MGGLLTHLQSARGNRGVLRYYRHRRMHRRRRRRRAEPWAGFHVQGCELGALGNLFVLVDWLVRVFELSGIVDRLSDCLSVQKNTLSESMISRSYYNTGIIP